jgi:hypothetical protein
MDVHAELQVDSIDEGEDHRLNQRFETDLQSGVRRSGTSRISGRVKDLSRSGFRIEAEERLPMNSVVWLKIAHLEPLMARVVWCDRLSAGCQFAAPLHPSVLNAILRSDEMR